MNVLCTQPSDPELDGVPPDGADDYLTTLEARLRTCEESVQVVCPFIDATGAEVLEAAYLKSGGTATWEVYTREPVDALVEAARKHGWLLYSYVADPDEGERGGFHCKLFVFDGEAAIVGSVNLIYTNLVENVEIGVLVEEPAQVAPLRTVTESIRTASTRLL